MRIAEQFAHTWLAFRRAFPYDPRRGYIPQGTPARPAKNVIDGVTRGERKRAARQRAIDAILAAHQAGKTDAVDEAWAFAARDGIAAIDFGEIEARVLSRADLGAEAERYTVCGGDPDWYVYELNLEAGYRSMVRGPYQAKKTANRVARTLNGH